MRTRLTLIKSCPQWLNRRLLLPVIMFGFLLLAATPVAPVATPARVSRVATATVQIIRLEPVSVQVDPQEAKPADRQYRQRDALPLVEFF